MFFCFLLVCGDIHTVYLFILFLCLQRYKIKLFDFGLLCHVTALDADVKIDAVVGNEGSYPPEAYYESA